MFDPSAPHIIILLIVVLLLFGSTRLPGAAQALGKSLHIFRRSVKGLEDEKDAAPQAPARLPAADPAQAQIAELQRQVAELQRQPAGGAAGNGAAGNGMAQAGAAEPAGDSTSS